LNFDREKFLALFGTAKRAGTYFAPVLRDRVQSRFEFAHEDRPRMAECVFTVRGIQPTVEERIPITEGL
jgi:hypothetical protein